jgi:hypothetical protein
MDDTNRTIRMVNLCQEMDLDGYMGMRVGKLPPGIDRLVVLTLELMTDPEVMILDEPMRGLSNDLGSDFMLRLERVADRGCAVLVFTHPMEAVRRCDALLVLHSRVVAYFGPPEEALEYFAVETLETIEQALKRASPELWHQLCRTSMWNSNFLHRKKPNRKQHHDHLVSGRLDTEWRPMPVALQVQGLLRRIGVRWRRTARPAVLLGASAIGGAIIGFVPGTDHQFPLLAASAFALGLLNAGSEIVRERSVLERERYFALSMPGYLLSIALVVVTSSVIASFVGVVAASVVGSLPGAFGVRVAAATSATLAGAGIGMLLSSLARETTQVRTLAIFLAIAQLVLLVVAPPIVSAYTPAGPAETALLVSQAPDFQGGVVLVTLAEGAVWLVVGWGLAVMALLRRREF